MSRYWTAIKTTDKKEGVSYKIERVPANRLEASGVYAGLSKQEIYDLIDCINWCSSQGAPWGKFS